MAIGIGIAVAVYGGAQFHAAKETTVMNFQECADAGNPVGESYPRQCWTEDGRHFVEDVDALPTAPPGLPQETPNPIEEPVYCTADAMQCPDGTWVGRTGPKCEFVCP